MDVGEGGVPGNDVKVGDAGVPDKAVNVGVGVIGVPDDGVRVGVGDGGVSDKDVSVSVGVGGVSDGGMTQWILRVWALDSVLPALAWTLTVNGQSLASASVIV